MAMILIVEEKQIFKEPFENPKIQAIQKVKYDESRKLNISVKRKRKMDSDCEDLTSMKRAKAIQASLAPELPSFVKYMMPSHVGGGFCMGLPLKFCRLHMPKEDTMITLEDENGKKFETKYLTRNGMLSGGWRGYSIKHKLKEGDALVFHLVTPSMFKIYTVRARAPGSDKLDGGGLEPISERDGSEIEGYGYDALDGIRLAESVIDFQEVKSIENFNIVVNGLIINSEFPKKTLTKYYDLCRSQQLYLHEHLLEGLYYKIGVAAIEAITTIADGIEACDVKKTTGKKLATWDRILEGFQVLGMNVDFLRAQVDQLRTRCVVES